MKYADKRLHFPKGDTTTSSYEFYTIIKSINDAIPTNHSNKLPERYNGALLKKSERTMEENDKVLRQLSLN